MKARLNLLNQLTNAIQYRSALNDEQFNNEEKHFHYL